MSPATIYSGKTLAQLEAELEAASGSFYELGLCLQEIHDRRLYYGEGVETFDEFLAANWKWGIPLLGAGIQAVEVPREGARLDYGFTRDVPQDELTTPLIHGVVAWQQEQSRKRRATSFIWRLIREVMQQVAGANDEMTLGEVRQALRQRGEIW
jgi:hypothetical protein